MASDEYHTSTSVESAAGSPSTGVYSEKSVRRAAFAHTGSSRLPSTFTVSAKRGALTSVWPLRPLKTVPGVTAAICNNAMIGSSTRHSAAGRARTMGTVPRRRHSPESAPIADFAVSKHSRGLGGARTTQPIPGEAHHHPLGQARGPVRRRGARRAATRAQHCRGRPCRGWTAWAHREACECERRAGAYRARLSQSQSGTNETEPVHSHPVSAPRSTLPALYNDDRRINVNSKRSSS